MGVTNQMYKIYLHKATRLPILCSTSYDIKDAIRQADSIYDFIKTNKNYVEPYTRVEIVLNGEYVYTCGGY